MARADAYAHCEQQVRAVDKDRFLAGLFAPANKRRHLYALYAFAHEIARVREAARQPLSGELRLQWWRDALEGIGEAASNPVTAALLDTMAACALPKSALIGLIDAHDFDLYDDGMRTLAELEAYVGATEGMLFALGTLILADSPASGAAGRVPDEVQAAAAPAGIAYGIAKILLDFPRHRGSGPLFVPHDVLAQHDVTREAVEAGEATPGLRAALAALRGRVRAAYDEFTEVAPALPDRAAPAFLTVALVPVWLERLDRTEPFMSVEVAQWRRQWALWRAARRWPWL